MVGVFRLRGHLQRASVEGKVGDSGELRAGAFEEPHGEADHGRDPGGHRLSCSYRNPCFARRSKSLTLPVDRLRLKSRRRYPIIARRSWTIQSTLSGSCESCSDQGRVHGRTDRGHARFAVPGTHREGDRRHSARATLF